MNARKAIAEMNQWIESARPVDGVKVIDDSAGSENDDTQ